MKHIFGLVGLVLSMGLWAQTDCPSLSEGAAQRIQNSINFLASDELEGRKPGTLGAQLAAAYIEAQFKRQGLGFLEGMDAYQQEFEIAEQVEVSPNTFLVVNNTQIKLNSGYFPTLYSANGEAHGESVYVKYGIVAPELKRNDYRRKRVEKKGIVIMDIGSPDGVHPHSAFLKYHDLSERIALAKEKGAKAVLLVNVEGQANDLSPRYKSIRSNGIPVLFVQNTETAKALINGAEVHLQVEQKPHSVKAYNVVGYLNNNASHTVIIGAHYDHLGYGGANSLYANKEEPTIHNGADDNASGTAGLLEIMRHISNNASKYGQHNFVFLAFSAEEEGLLGSAFFAKHAGINMDSVSYMLNMDMIGRMEENTLAVNGVGTSSFWEEVVVDACGLTIKTTESGTGPSDHTSFYNQGVPVLHFFTGTHTDYHKPSDDAEKINAEGELMVLRYMLRIIEDAEAIKDLPFSKTKADTTSVPRFSVTLGVMPDYLYSGKGMKIDGVTEERPAAKAGLQAGDIVTQLGQVKVVDMMSYMKALGQFNKGDKAPLTYLRGEEEIQVEVEF